ncbi:MAG TPA: DUF3052 domain-containing protein [Chthoniobacterales bacterium]|nr:DUF3052 domain-containing protein [Chthoniobacterales bacterium]
MAGYSGTPLPQKLGIKPGSTVVALNQPANYESLLGKAAHNVKFSHRAVRGASFVHLFTTSRRELEKGLSMLRAKVADSGVVWVSWPKKSSGVPSDVTEDTIRKVGLPLGFVDVKVCAVDEIWSGLKLMIRRENRKSK